MSFPEELKQKKQWVCWRLEPNPDGDKPRKVPYNAITGGKAMSNKPETWCDYTTAFDAMERYGYTGLGYMFVKEDGIVGVDIDHCIDEQGNMNDIAKSILACRSTYTERSPSGTGLHLLFKGVKPKGASKNTDTGVEMYDSARYFTVTGQQLEGSPDTVCEGQDALDYIYETYIKKQPMKKGKKKSGKTQVAVQLTDEELLEKAKFSEGGAAFAKLYGGVWQGDYPSQSEADMALCMKLAFWSGKDREQMDRLFRASGLFRPKWDEKHRADGTTYGEETLTKAIDATANIYAPGGEPVVYEAQGRYWRIRGENTYPLTNFVFEPIEMIQSDEDTQLTADLVTVRGEKFRLSFMTSDFANPQRFKNLLNKNTISLSYLGGEGDLEMLKSYVSGLEWTVKTGVKAMGIYNHTGRLVFVSKDGSIEQNGVAVDDIVQLERYKSIDSHILRTDSLQKEKLPELGKWLMSYNEPAKAISILAWAAACFLKEHLRMENVKFPHLFLIGEAGSGKSTTLERILLPIFSVDKVTAASQVTSFTLMKEAASSNIIPYPLDEFKPSKMDRMKLGSLYNHFRDAYDGHAGVRGRADLSVVSYELLAPMIVAGEESPDEAAIRERSVELLFSKKDLKNIDRKMMFKRLSSNETLLEDFGRTLLDMALRTENSEVYSWYNEGTACFVQELPSRIISNLSCCYAGLKLLEKVCVDYGYAWDDVFPHPMKICTEYLEYAAKDYLLDGETSNKSIVEQTFEIMARMKLDPKVYYRIDGEKLYLKLNAVYDLYTKYRRDYAILGEVLTYSQFKKQLQYSEYFIASNVQCRIGGDSVKCWVLDFATLSKNCDVSGFGGTNIEPLV